LKFNAKAILPVLITFLIFTASPLIILQIIPVDILNLLVLQGFNLPDLLTNFALVGIILTIFTLLKGFTEPTSMSHLLISLSSHIFWLVITVFALGLGSIETLGISIISTEIRGISNTIMLDLRLFVYLFILITFLKMIQSILSYQEGMLKK
jgi:hypothetical protein